eukprot:TRINITY_DN12349_c0_g1_i1.p2 TRINITY_DN12349_c0_g1~~TRINITY_DN12349_c0_g1_i1.p2  ORF type:complete len:262 (-),score=125.72 TRINITY_DN12349_c0_g1_i1:439-1173(-)
MAAAQRERMNERFAKALNVGAARASPAVGAAAAAAVAAATNCENDFARSLPTMPRSTVARTSSGGAKRKAAAASPEGSEDEADVRDLLVKMTEMREQSNTKKFKKSIEAKAAQLHGATRRAAAVDVKAAHVSIAQDFKELQAELGARKAEMAAALRELLELGERHRDAWARKREEVKGALAEIEGAVTELGTLEVLYSEQSAIAAKHIKDQCAAKIEEVELIVKDINAEMPASTGLYGQLASIC